MTVDDQLAAEISTATGTMRTAVFRPSEPGHYPGLLLYSEIFQITGPIRRTATLFASHGYIVAVPEIYHEMEPAGTVLPYDQAGADKGNVHKFAKPLAAYDDDARSALQYLASHLDCTGKLGVVGICIGGPLAFRAAMNPEVLAAACFYATDIHSGTLGLGQNDDSLARASEIKGELLHVWGRQDPPVPFEGRTKVRARLEEVGANYQWLEMNAAHAFLRDEGPRYNAALASQCYSLALDLFHRRLR